MEFFNSAVDVLKTLVVALGAGLGVWGAVNLMEGYGGDNPSANVLMCRKETQKNLIDSPTISVKKCLQMERTELYLLWE